MYTIENGLFHKDVNAKFEEKNSYNYK